MGKSRPVIAPELAQRPSIEHRSELLLPCTVEQLQAFLAYLPAKSKVGYRSKCEYSFSTVTYNPVAIEVTWTE